MIGSRRRFSRCCRRLAAFVRRSAGGRAESLSLSEREEISRGLIVGRSLRAIAAQL
ncbi:helix-turn-helix domain-containing protein, partial [Sphingomonas sp. Ant20]|uniref:helix-turn-helix domain-containing protein n=1 Tax=Sphingomonas sp. Ant20 TaxID=104605 RepID=UPI00325FA1F5